MSADPDPRHVEAVRRAAFRRLLAAPQPVTPDALAADTGLDEAIVADILTWARPRGRVEFDGEAIVGVAGLTVAPTRHELRFGDEIRWTWCALDAVGILGALGADGEVSSVDPASGEPIHIEFRAGIPSSDAVLFVADGLGSGNTRRDWCPQVNFFASRTAAEDWVTEHDRHGRVVGVEEIVEEATGMWAPLVSQAYTKSTPRAVPYAPAPMDIRRFEDRDRSACVELAVRAFTPIYEVQRTLLGDDLFPRLHPDHERPRAELTAQRLEEDDVWVAVDGDDVVGFVAVFLDRDNGIGHIDLVAVAPERRRRGIGSALVDNAIGHIESSGMAYISAFPYTDPGHEPALALLATKGLSQVTAQPILLGRPLDQEPADPDPHIRPATATDVAPCRRFGVEAFRPVFEEMERQYGEDLFARFRPDWEGEQDRYIAEALVDPERSAWVYEAEGQPVGFGVCSTYGEGVGQLEVIAVDPDHLGTGVGSALIAHSMDAMQASGDVYAVIGTGDDPGHAPARRSYERAGFTLMPLQRRILVKAADKAPTR